MREHRKHEQAKHRGHSRLRRRNVDGWHDVGCLDICGGPEAGGEQSDGAPQRGGTPGGGGTGVDGPIDGTVDSNSIQLSTRSGFAETPLLRASCEQISGLLSGSALTLRRAVPYTVDGTWMGSKTGDPSKMVVVLQQMGNNVTGTLSGAGTVDGPIEGTVQGKTIQLRERNGFRGTPQLNLSCEQISGPLYDGTTVNLRRIP